MKGGIIIIVYRYDTANLTGQQKAIINQRDRGSTRIKQSSDESTQGIKLESKKVFHEKDFQELRELLEKEQNIKLKLKENTENYFIINEENLTNRLSTAEGTVDIVFRLKGQVLIVSNLYLRITGVGTASNIIEWFINFCKKNNLVAFMIRIVKKDNIKMVSLCKKYNFKNIDNNDVCDDYILKIV